MPSRETPPGDDALPPALSSMWRLCKLGFRFEPRLMGVAFVLSLAAALPDALVALWFKLLAEGVETLEEPNRTTKPRARPPKTEGAAAAGAGKKRKQPQLQPEQQQQQPKADSGPEPTKKKRPRADPTPAAGTAAAAAAPAAKKVGGQQGSTPAQSSMLQWWHRCRGMLV